MLLSRENIILHFILVSKPTKKEEPERKALVYAHRFGWEKTKEGKRGKNKEARNGKERKAAGE